MINMSSTIRSFMFHDVRDLDDTDYPNRYNLKSFLRKNQFEYQIDFIMNNYKVIRSDDVKNIDFNDGVDYAILTFDDGLKDHYYVYNYLKSKNISGTFLVPSLPILDHKMIPTHKIQFILSVVNEKSLSDEILSCFDNVNDVWDKYSETKWKNNWWTKEMIFITNILRYHKTETFDNYKYIDYLFGKYVSPNEAEFSKDIYLEESHLEEMSNNNMIVGGHGNTSENLLLVDDISYDINRSFDLVKKYSDKYIFSYPNGGFSGDIKDALIKCNCELSFTVKPMTITNLDTVDYLEFPRYDAPQKLPLL